MADIVSTSVRSRMMSGIRGRNTAPEIALRRLLHGVGFRYRLHARDLPGRPDIVLPRYRVAMFTHGCFWHQHEGCRFAKMPSSNRRFWEVKLLRNRERDAEAIRLLRKADWRVLVVWECSVRDRTSLDLERLQDSICQWIKSSRVRAELPRRKLASGVRPKTVRRK